MASTHGRKTLPLPHSLTDGLTTLGFVETADSDLPAYRLPRHPAYMVTATASNIPGDATVIAEIHNGVVRKTTRLGVDALLAAIVVDVMILDDPHSRWKHVPAPLYIRNRKD